MTTEKENKKPEGIKCKICNLRHKEDYDCSLVNKKKPVKKVYIKLTEIEQEEQNEFSEDTLSKKQELFCQTFATKGGLFGNGVQTYMEVYSPDKSKPNWYKTACSTASEILANPKVTRRINELLETGGLNDVEVDKQHKYLIEQHFDLGTKMRAISEYNKLKQRITAKLELSGDVKVTDSKEIDAKGIDDLKDFIQEQINGKK